MKRGLEEKRIAHAYLFVGPRGVGKFTCAKLFAAELLSRNNPENSQEVRGRVLREVHPDLLVTEPQGRYLLVDQVRELLRELSVKPLEGACKVALVDDAEAMTGEAANALLKTLEEPPGEAVIILISSQPERLLPTIQSRCYRVDFQPLKAEEIKHYLVRKRGVSEGKADLLIRVSAGIFGKALSYLGDDQKLRRFQEAVEVGQRLPSASLLEVMESAKRIVDTVEEQIRKERSRREAWLSEWREALDSRTRERMERWWKTRLDRELGRERYQMYCDILDGMATWFRDIMVYALVLEDEGERESVSLLNEDARESIHEMAHRIYVERALLGVEACESAKVKLAMNAQPLLLLENLLIYLHEICGGPFRG